MKLFNTWLDDLMPDLPGCPQALALYHLKRAVIDFCKRTRLYAMTTPAMDVAANTTEFALPVAVLPADQMLLSVRKAWWYGEPMNPYSLGDIEAKYGFDWVTQTGTPESITWTQDETVRLVPFATTLQAGALVLSITYGPNETATGVPDAFYNRYREQIAAGAKGRLMAIAKKPWTDAEMAKVWAEAFDSACGGAATRVARGPAGAALVTKPYQF